MKRLKENSVILRSKTLTFSLINKIKSSSQLSNTLNNLNWNVYNIKTKKADKKNFEFVFDPITPFNY